MRSIYVACVVAAPLLAWIWVFHHRCDICTQRGPAWALIAQGKLRKKQYSELFLLNNRTI